MKIIKTSQRHSWEYECRKTKDLSAQSLNQTMFLYKLQSAKLVCKIILEKANYAL